MITTVWTGRVKPETDWGQRLKPTTQYDRRVKPYRYITPLQDATNIVCNENWVIIYIFANEWKPIPTMWTRR